MNFGKRKFEQLRYVLSHKETYKALCTACRVLHKPWQAIAEEVFSSKLKTSSIKIKTPLGSILIYLFDKVDLSTVFGIFCRQDYTLPSKPHVVLDIGANIGVATLYFLTRHKDSFVYAYEPVPDNIKKFKKNTSLFADRVTLVEAAVGNDRGIVSFGVESTGKFGGVTYASEETIDVPLHHINNVLEQLLAKHPVIDCIKIDVEGLELTLISVIDKKYWPRIKMIYAENSNSSSLLQPGFIRTYRYNVEQLLQTTR